MKDILLIEDNRELAQLIQTFLERSGFSVVLFQEGEAALDWLEQHATKLVLLDIMLPGMDGFQVCEQIRKKEHLPILMLSAKSMKEDKLLGFELGADDYIEKPVDTDVLIAKIKALWARSYPAYSATLKSGALYMDIEAHTVYLDNRELSLNGKEFELLQVFMENPQKTLHKDFLFQHIWGMDSESEAQTLTVHIKMLRSKIEENPKDPKQIVTVWGIGYRYEAI